MTAPLREQSINNGTTTLNGAIDSSQTSITVTSGAVFPATGNFRIKISNEIMLVTARSTNDLTVVRGYEGTSAASHGDLTTATLILTADSHDRFGKDNHVLWGYSSLPPLNKLVGTDGSTILTSSDFTWNNQGGASVADAGGTIALRAPPSSGNNIRTLYRPTPAPSWTLIAAIKAVCFADDGGTQNPQIGVVLRQSTSSKLFTFGFNRQSTVAMRFGLDKWTNDTSFSSTPWKVTNPVFHGELAWFKITDNNTNLVFSISNDGLEWHQIFSEARGTFMTLNGGVTGPDQFGISINNGANSSGLDSINRLVHWHTE
jgi:hypothetical protein